jgi:serine/threonine protein kinase
VVQLQFQLLSRATDNFNERGIIGGGASCAVYRAQVFGVDVAIKRLKDDAVEWEAKQYESETALLAGVAHENICRLFASSSDGLSKCLVLELCTGGSLEGRLGQPAPAALAWQQRVRIAQQVARALVHLHDLKPQMIHRCVGCSSVTKHLVFSASCDVFLLFCHLLPLFLFAAISSRPTCCLV